MDIDEATGSDIMSRIITEREKQEESELPATISNGVCGISFLKRHTRASRFQYCGSVDNKRLVRDR
jgi:hypothetical protein